MNEPSNPSNPPPNMSRADAEAMIKLMDQELAIQRAKLQMQEASDGNRNGRWIALFFVLFLLLAIVAAGAFWVVTHKPEVSKPPTPARAPGR